MLAICLKKGERGFTWFCSSAQKPPYGAIPIEKKRELLNDISSFCSFCQQYLPLPKREKAVILVLIHDAPVNRRLDV